MESNQRSLFKRENERKRAAAEPVGRFLATRAVDRARSPAGSPHWGSATEHGVQPATWLGAQPELGDCDARVRAAARRRRKGRRPRVGARRRPGAARERGPSPRRRALRPLRDGGGRRGVQGVEAADDFFAGRDDRPRVSGFRRRRRRVPSLPRPRQGEPTQARPDAQKVPRRLPGLHQRLVFSNFHRRAADPPRLVRRARGRGQGLRPRHLVQARDVRSGAPQLPRGLPRGPKVPRRAAAGRRKDRAGIRRRGHGYALNRSRL
mmetsp:Transcript_3320/g.10057  ORF Transcript_3320/g.10057 Transcript_3320/m.10057 type:complete len:264 (+) Transcript_3320:1-792(+)